MQYIYIGQSRWLRPLVLLGLLSFGCATAPHPAASPTTRQSFLTDEEFDYRSLLGDPPAEGSAEHRMEVDRMLALQASRTPEEERRCKSEEAVTAFAFAPELGPWFNARQLPVTAALMQEVYVLAKAVSDPAKRQWGRIRPPLADPRIHPCVDLEKTPSYPSGHAVRGIVWATLLAEIFPEQRNALMARGRQIGDDRFLAGMHYPSDVAAGQKLGAAVAARLLENPRFQKALEKAKAECLASH